MSDSEESYEFDPEKFYHQIKRNMNILNDKTQEQSYKNTFTTMIKLIDESKYDLNEKLIQRLLLEFGQTLLEQFSAKKEKVREMAIDMYEELMSRCESISPFIVHVLYKLQERLNCNDLEGILDLPEVMRPKPSQIPLRIERIVETCEEVRLKLCRFLKSLFEITTKEEMRSNLDISVDCLRALCMDPFNDIQILACQTLQLFCENYQSLLLHFAEILGRALLLPLVSKKSKTKMAALNAIGSVLLCGVWKKNNDVIEMLIGFKDPNSVPIKAFFESTHNINYLATLLEDPKDSVRELFIRQLGDWTIRLPDRQDHFPRMVPYVLSGVFDRNIEIGRLAVTIIEEVGKSLELENEKDYRENKQYGIEADWTLNGHGLEGLYYPSPFIRRPCLGARIFIRSQVRKFWKALFAEMRDWKDANRKSSSQLLWVSVFYSEDYMTQYADSFLRHVMPYCVRHVQDKGNPHIEEIIGNVGLALRLLGRYLQFVTYFETIKPSLERQLNVDMETVRHSVEALRLMVEGDLEVVVKGKGLQAKIDIPVKIFGFFSKQSILDSVDGYCVDSFIQLMINVMDRLTVLATADELNFIIQNHNEEIISIMSACVFVKYLEQYFVYDNSLNSVQQIQKDIIDIRIINKYIEMLKKANRLEDTQTYFNQYLKDKSELLGDINYMNQDYKLIYFIIIYQFYQHTDNQIQHVQNITQSQEILNQVIIKDKSQSLLITNIKFNYVLIKLLIDDSKINSSLFQQQMANINYLLKFDEKKIFFSSQYNLLQQLICQISQVMSHTLNELTINQYLIQNYCEVMDQIISNQDNKDNKITFNLILQFTECINKCSEQYKNNFQEDFNYKDEKNQLVYGFIKLFDFCIKCYSTIDDSTDINHINKIFVLFQRTVQIIDDKKITTQEMVKQYNNVQCYVNTLIKNYLDESNQYINEKVLDIMNQMINKQKYFFEKEYVQSIQNKQFGRITLLKKLLKIK